MEIELSEYQANVFTEVENLLKTNGYYGEPLFEDTYVIQKDVVEYVKNNISITGDISTIQSEALNVYNTILGINTRIDTEPPPIGNNTIIDTGTLTR